MPNFGCTFLLKTLLKCRRIVDNIVETGNVKRVDFREHNPKNCSGRRSIRWPLSDVMKPDRAYRIDQDIPTPLADIAGRFLRQPAVQHLFQVSPPGLGPPDIPETGGEHSIGPVEFPVLIDQEGPGQVGLFYILAGEIAGLKGDDYDLDPEFRKTFFITSQLQQVSPTRQSP